jgi:hypothetical protein
MNLTREHAELVRKMSMDGITKEITLTMGQD